MGRRRAAHLSESHDAGVPDGAHAITYIPWHEAAAH